MIKDGIQIDPSEKPEDKELLMRVMKIISDVKVVEPSTDKIVRRMKDMVQLLKKHNVPMEEEYLNKIDNIYT